MKSDSIKKLASNRKAFHDYFIEESIEAGIELCGTEVKSVRGGNLNLKDSWCEIKNGEMWLRSMHISPYENGNVFNRDPVRTRRLLLHKRETLRFFSIIKQEGLTLIPLSVYLKGSHVKVQVGLCKGKKNYDKREAIARKTAARDMERSMKSR